TPDDVIERLADGLCLAAADAVRADARLLVDHLLGQPMVAFSDYKTAHVVLLTAPSPSPIRDAAVRVAATTSHTTWLGQAAAAFAGELQVRMALDLEDVETSYPLVPVRRLGHDPVGITQEIDSWVAKSSVLLDPRSHMAVIFGGRSM